MKKLIFSILLVLLSIHPIYAQNRVIQGKAIDYFDFEPILYADIIINDSVKIGRTGLDGCFQFEVSLPVNKLTFQSIGYEFADLKITEDCNYIELIMVPDFTYCFMSYRKINKERRKLYKKLPELHQEAYEKGIFQSPEVCYIQEFVEYK